MIGNVSSQTPTVRRLAWQARDVELYAPVVYSQLKVGARILSYLVGRIGVEAGGDELADALGLDTGRLGVSGDGAG
ncbi:hypothetical protein [Actinoplanes sp. M2I2]|uniref:hypothetical protein n=1 Tax=Actinoplanes sp. M2I2 TaxID=1734444 RepID=UPI0020206A5A|nr:hypothetical protein [Actinoplanes sp. M2I2]